MTPPLKTVSEVPDWYVFLRRNPLTEPESRREEYRAHLAGKRVLVTGAGGCIGSALAKCIARSDARQLILVDASEGALYNIDRSITDLQDAPQHLPVLASVCDAAAMANVFARHSPQIVFHAAAFKHVPLMESNPFAAVANNAFGTQVVAEAAIKYGCEQILMVSTDKAVDPSSIMGASKRIAELVMLAPRTESTCMKIVRLGNVLGSSGSVVPLFLRQIARGGPVTVSHSDVRRYFMTLNEAVETLFCALSSNSPARLLIPKLGEPIRVLDLAKYLIGPEKEVPILFTELRPGDKMEESLVSQLESFENIANSSLQAVRSPALSPEELSSSLNDLGVAVGQHDLPSLLQAVQRMVPEYRPSLSLRAHLQASATVNA